MKAGNDILELKFEGITRKNVRPGELGVLIYEFERIILSTVKSDYPAINTEEILVNFESIKDESIGINLTPNLEIVGSEIKQLIVDSYLSFTSELESGNFQNLSIGTLKSLKRIQQFSKKYNTTAFFRKNGENLSSLHPETKFKVTKSNLLGGNTTIYGELFDAGGETPNIHIRINDQYNVIVGATKDVVKELAGKLYEIVGLKGYAKWDIKTSEIQEFELHNIVGYKSGGVKESFKKLRELSSGYWDKFDTTDEINNQLLRD